MWRSAVFDSTQDQNGCESLSGQIRRRRWEDHNERVDDEHKLDIGGMAVDKVFGMAPNTVVSLSTASLASLSAK